MIHRIPVQYRLTCNKCRKSLDHPEDSAMIAHRGFPIYEDTRKNILKVAKDMNWDIYKQLCPNCK